MTRLKAIKKVSLSSIFPILLNGILSLSIWLIAFALAWIILSQQNFYYTTWYKLLGIEQTITTYGAQNRFGKQNFSTTKEAQHKYLFADIVDSINNQGVGLKDIRYRLGASTYLLLTKAEVQHLQDVADVLTSIRPLVIAAIIMIFVLNIYFYWRQQSPALLKQQSKYSFLVIIIILLATFLAGAEKVFYWLHELIFADHQWFFYYQDSLMSTLMQAPNIFAPIAIVWLLLAVVLWFILIVLQNKLHVMSNKKAQL